MEPIYVKIRVLVYVENPGQGKDGGAYHVMYLRSVLSQNYTDIEEQWTTEIH